MKTKYYPLLVLFLLSQNALCQVNIALNYSNSSTTFKSKRTGDEGIRYLNLMHGFSFSFGETQSNDNRSYFAISHHSAIQSSDKMVKLYKPYGAKKYYSSVYIEPIRNGTFVGIEPEEKYFNYQNTYSIVNITFTRLWRIHKKSTKALKHYIGLNGGFLETTNGLLVNHPEAVKTKYEKRLNQSIIAGISYMNELKLNKRFALTCGIDTNISLDKTPAITAYAGLRYYFKFNSNLEVK